MPRDDWKSTRYRDVMRRSRKAASEKRVRFADKTHWTHTSETISGEKLFRCREFVQMLIRNGYKHRELERMAGTRYPRAVYMPVIEQLRQQWLNSHSRLCG